MVLITQINAGFELNINLATFNTWTNPDIFHFCSYDWTYSFKLNMRYSFLVIILILSGTSIFSQSLDEIRVNGQYSEQPVGEIVQQLLTNQPIKLFIADRNLLSQTKSVSFQVVPLTKALEQIFQETPADYIIYRDYSIIVGPRSKINQSYSADYYSRLEEIVSQQVDENEMIIGSKDLLQPIGAVSLTGTISDDLTAEKIIGASVILEDSSDMTVTNSLGRFTLQVPTGQRKLIVQTIGYDRLEIPLMVFSDDDIEVNLSKNVLNLDEVTIEAVAEDVNVESIQIGVARIDMKGINKIPVFMGEVDIEKVLLLQPGVSKVAEGSSGFNVRGGEVDQNLVMQDEGILVNYSHALGFLSTFNPDMVQSVVLHKGYMPAYYGGRLASVLDVKMRNASLEDVKLKLGLSPITGRLNLELPVVKHKSSINLGVRYNYADLLLKLAKSPDVTQSSSFFYDAQFRYAHNLNENNSLELSCYSSYDDFRYSNEFEFDYQTLMGQVALKSQINERLFSNFSLTASKYQSSRTELEESTASRLDNFVDYFKLKELLTFSWPNGLKVDAGISGIYYKVNPGAMMPASDISSVRPTVLEDEQGLESAVFFQTDWEVSPNLALSAGIRGVLYQYLGPKTVYLYEEGQPILVENITDTLVYEKGEAIETYYSLEPRFSFRYRLTPSASFKAGYSRTVQYINQFSNFTAPTPSSVWQLSNSYIEPTRAHNFSVGFFKNLKNNLWETSIEGYYRLMDDLYDYRDFADLNVNDHLETELASGRGRSYGVELSLKKKRGLLNGWLSYTLSRTERQIDEINNGNWYLSNLDRTHDISLVGIFEFNERHSLTFNFNYATGRPITAPIGSYRNENGLIIPIYSDRNELRIPDFHRLDISYTVGQGYNRSKKIKTSWSFSVYNLYGRKNPYSVFFTQKPFNPPVANRFSVLGSVFPSIAFNIEIQ